MEMVQAGDQPHIAAMEDMMKLSQEDQKQWYEDFKNSFDSFQTLNSLDCTPFNSISELQSTPTRKSQDLSNAALCGILFLRLVFKQYLAFKQ